MEKVKLLNTNVANLSMKEAVNEIEQYIHGSKKAYVVAVNVDVIMRMEHDAELKKITDDADMVIVDGKPLIWISKIHRRSIKEKISGSDLIPELCRLAGEKGYSLFILGGAEGIAEKAKKNIEEKYPGCKVVGTYAPPLGFEKDESEVERINSMISEKSPDILVVCLGCPKQEKFIYHNIEKHNAKISVCAGATVDFLAGNIRRAPKLMSDYGLEWFYRFLQEPGRMFKRYFIDDMKIIKLIWKYR